MGLNLVSNVPSIFKSFYNFFKILISREKLMQILNPLIVSIQFNSFIAPDNSLSLFVNIQEACELWRTFTQNRKVGRKGK